MHSRSIYAQHKLDVRRKATPEGCTFAPKINSSSGRFKLAAKRGDTFERLFSESKSLRDKQVRVRLETFANDGDCTFAPQISRNSKRLNRQRQGQLLRQQGQEQTQEQTHDGSFEMLFSDAQARRNKLEELKRAADAAVEETMGPCYYSKARRKAATENAAAPPEEKYKKQRKVWYRVRYLKVEPTRETSFCFSASFSAVSDFSFSFCIMPAMMTMVIILSERRPAA